MLTFLREREEISRSEPPTHLDSEADSEVAGEPAQTAGFDTSETVTEIAPSVSSEEELYVEVGDTVTYCFAKKPDVLLTVTIVEGESNAHRNLTNENSPLAQALLNCRVGDESEFRVNDSQPRVIRVIKIQRQQTFHVEEQTSQVDEKNVSTEAPPAFIGQQTSFYPLGYGYCQCGCRQVTKMIDKDGAWVWARYVTGHESM